MLQIEFVILENEFVILKNHFAILQNQSHFLILQNDPDVAKTLHHDKYVVVSADNAQKQHSFCLQNVLHPMFIIRGRRRK